MRIALGDVTCLKSRLVLIDEQDDKGSSKFLSFLTFIFARLLATRKEVKVP